MKESFRLSGFTHAPLFRESEFIVNSVVLKLDKIEILRAKVGGLQGFGDTDPGLAVVRSPLSGDAGQAAG